MFLTNKLYTKKKQNKNKTKQQLIRRRNFVLLDVLFFSVCDPDLKTNLNVCIWFGTFVYSHVMLNNVMKNDSIFDGLTSAFL